MSGGKFMRGSSDGDHRDLDDRQGKSTPMTQSGRKQGQAVIPDAYALHRKERSAELTQSHDDDWSQSQDSHPTHQNKQPPHKDTGSDHRELSSRYDEHLLASPMESNHGFTLDSEADSSTYDPERYNVPSSSVDDTDESPIAYRAHSPNRPPPESRYQLTMREAGVTSPVSSTSIQSISPYSSSSSSSPSSDGKASQSETRSDAALLSRASSVSTATTAATTQIHIPTKRPGQPQFEGFWQVRSWDDLRPMLDNSSLAMKERRADPNGGFMSPLKALATNLHHTYHLVNPAFVYELAFNPRRVLTKPSKPMYNDGHDNEDSDYILYVNDWLGTEEGHRYLILDVLGQGTFGQVVKCQNMSTHEIVAVKVIKNKKAYFNQSMMEVTILETLNQHWDPQDQHNILRLQDTFIHAKHLCLVFELLSSNLYELIKQNSFRGLSTSLVRVFITQLLDALIVLKDAQLIHCDLKPENILLRTLQAPSIKLVDFGSACHEEQTVYTYIQSRFYRSPEVLLGVPYTSAIDMWSLGCIAAELFLGLPIFPGTSEYNQISRIVAMLGLPPQYMLDAGRQTNEFFNVHSDAIGRTSYAIKPLDQYSREHRVQEQASKQYFPGTTLPEIIRLAPITRRSGRSADTEKEMANRAAFTDFVAGLLNLDPVARWTPQQAKLHPFITGESFQGTWQPPPTSLPNSAPRSHPDYYASANSAYYVHDSAPDHAHAYHYPMPQAPPPSSSIPTPTYSSSRGKASNRASNYAQNAYAWNSATPIAHESPRYAPSPSLPTTQHTSQTMPANPAGGFAVVVHNQDPSYDTLRKTPHARTPTQSALQAASLATRASNSAYNMPSNTRNPSSHMPRRSSRLPTPTRDMYAPAYTSANHAFAYDSERRDIRRNSQQDSQSLLPMYVNQVSQQDWDP
ncbi:dual-specificity kinase [Malassezia psittaci]|uniref:Dual-specificity kinase n=1 Tax=Malassezia psittaci TaxID=1821823 RepID=A0AAF0FCK4_9BASI|nr:dual-specificity kinase [Malassezia psittaci]